MQVVVENTNIAIRHFRDQFQEIIENSDKYNHFNYIDVAELKSFIIILHLRVCLKQNLFSSCTIWYHESANDIFVATMGLKRFSFICRFLQFDDKSIREERWKTDIFLRKSTETMPMVASQVHIYQLSYQLPWSYSGEQTHFKCLSE